jgi:hypothetical protein
LLPCRVHSFEQLFIAGALIIWVVHLGLVVKFLLYIRNKWCFFSLKTKRLAPVMTLVFWKLEV